MPVMRARFDIERPNGTTTSAQASRATPARIPDSITGPVPATITLTRRCHETTPPGHLHRPALRRRVSAPPAGARRRRRTRRAQEELVRRRAPSARARLRAGRARVSPARRKSEGTRGFAHVLSCGAPQPPRTDLAPHRGGPGVELDFPAKSAFSRRLSRGPPVHYDRRPGSTGRHARQSAGEPEPDGPRFHQGRHARKRAVRARGRRADAAVVRRRCGSRSRVHPDLQGSAALRGRGYVHAESRLLPVRSATLLLETGGRPSCRRTLWTNHLGRRVVLEDGAGVAHGRRKAAGRSEEEQSAPSDLRGAAVWLL